MPNNDDDDDNERGLLARFSLFLIDIPSRSQFPHPTLTMSMQIWTNYETHIFKKWGKGDPKLPCGSASV